jgi:hypothetical protein
VYVFYFQLKLVHLFLNCRSSRNRKRNGDGEYKYKCVLGPIFIQLVTIESPARVTIERSGSHKAGASPVSLWLIYSIGITGGRSSYRVKCSHVNLLKRLVGVPSNPMAFTIYE